MSDTALVDAIGLSMTTLFPSMGKTAEDNFDKILDILSKKIQTNSLTLAEIVDGFKMWCITCQLPSKPVLLKTHAKRLFDAVALLAQSNDASGSGEYKGDVYAAAILAEGLDSVAKMDTTQELLATFAPIAFDVVETILKSGSAKLDAKTPMKSNDTIETRRGDAVSTLLGILPYSKESNIPNAISVISALLKGNYPEAIKAKGRSALQPMGSINREGLVNSGPDIIELMKLGGNDLLGMQFVSVPSMYFNNPSAVHDNLSLFLSGNFMMYASLFTNIASKHPEALVSHVDFFIQQLSNPSVGAMVLSILDNIAAKHASVVYPHKSTIISKGKNVQMGEYMVAKVIGKLSVVSKAADACFEDLLSLMDSTNDNNAITGIFAEISNVMVLVSSRDIVLKSLDRIGKHKGASALLFKEIDDYAHGRSLKEVTLRLEVLDAKVNALNTKVAETCTNMADVLAYVDANMADMKDFLAQVTKRLPQPKRLEIVGTLRKTLILHFECCRTGLEFPITSHEWSKWLKMGFSLVKAGQAIIDLGMGNPLGILKKGAECVQEIYEAYKTNDDDEFNTYITNPFLLSHEQDQLLEKLRAQGFFDIFAYDAQKAGWYLVNPEKDGRAPEGDSGSVSKVWTKKGYGVTEGIVATASAALGTDLSPVNDLIAAAASNETAGAGVELKATSTTPSSSSSAAAASSTGGRAAAMREQFGPAANRSADEKLADANRAAQYQQKVDVLEGKVSELEKKVANLTTSLEEVRNRPAGCSCTIC